MRHKSSNQISNGVGQLTIVEHALCPIDGRESLHEQLRHETTFRFTDKERKRRTGRVRVFCPLGLSPNDEFYLWGLLALTLADESSAGELHATRHYILRNLGIINPGSRRGGRQYAAFTEAIDRVAAIQYFNDSFYDPIRAEHTRINFKFFSYSQPGDQSSSRAWRIVWDPVFFQFAQAARGTLRFDLATYRKLDVASRRLYLFASKLLSRCDTTYPIDVGELTVDVLGYDPALNAAKQNARLRASLRRLVGCGVLRSGETRLYKRSKMRYSVVMAKGQLLNRRRADRDFESPLLEPLRLLGFEPLDAQRLVSHFPRAMVREWIDITLAAEERFGRKFFTRSPAAYLRYNLNRAAAGTGTPPDWWHEVRKAEERAHAARARNRRSAHGPTRLPQRAMNSLDEVREDIFDHFLTAGQSKKQAADNARRFQSAVSRSRK